MIPKEAVCEAARALLGTRDSGRRRPPHGRGEVMSDDKDDREQPVMWDCSDDIVGPRFVAEHGLGEVLVLLPELSDATPQAEREKWLSPVCSTSEDAMRVYERVHELRAAVVNLTAQLHTYSHLVEGPMSRQLAAEKARAERLLREAWSQLGGDSDQFEEWLVDLTRRTDCSEWLDTGCDKPDARRTEGEIDA